jgi:hypothetical protein
VQAYNYKYIWLSKDKIAKNNETIHFILTNIKYQIPKSISQMKINESLKSNVGFGLFNQYKSQEISVTVVSEIAVV